MKTVQRTMILTLCVAALAPLYAQGVYWESTTTGEMMREKSLASQFFYMPRKFKTVSVDNSEAMIVRLDKEEIVMVDLARKRYAVMTFAEMEAMVTEADARMNAHKAEIEKQMANLPEEQRKMMEQYMKGMMKMDGGKTDVVNTGEKKTINGYECTKYVVGEGGDPVTVWATKGVKEFRIMRKDMEEFTRRLASLTPLMSKNMVEGVNSIDGFPIQTEIGNKVKSVVTKVETRTTPASEFDAPAGFTKVSREEMMGDGLE